MGSSNFEMLGTIQEAVASGVDAKEILTDKSNTIQWKLMMKACPEHQDDVALPASTPNRHAQLSLASRAMPGYGSQ